MPTVLDKVLNLARQYRKSTWLLGVFLTYVLLGFLVLPPVLKSILPDLIRDNLQRDGAAQEVRFNPLTLELRVTDLRIADDADGELLTVDGLVVNLELASLFRLALVLKEVAIDTLEFNVTAYEPTHYGNLTLNLTGWPQENMVLEIEDEKCS